MNKESDFIFGLRPIIEAIKTGRTIDRLLLKKGLSGELYYELMTEAKRLDIPFQFVPPEKLNSITRKNHQGAVAWLSAIEYSDIFSLLPGLYESGKDPLILILFNISDIRNFGAIARSGECFGVDCIIIPDKGTARINADAIKTSSGALHRIPVSRVKSISKTIEFLKESGLRIFAASEKSDNNPDKNSLTGPAALIMGSEDKGISSIILDEADVQLSIPMTGEIESLNVSVATGILLYEITRQRLAQT